MSEMKLMSMLVLFTLGSPAVMQGWAAQTATQATPERKLDCLYSRPQNPALKKKLWHGFEVSVGPTPRREDYPDTECTAAIYSQNGKVVFRTTGFSTTLDRATGMDVDGDGSPDVVFITDTGGGMHCCWEYEVISLSPEPRLLFRYTPAGGASFRRDKNGRVVLWSTEGGFADWTSMARRPFATMVFRFDAGKLKDVTPEFCSEITGGQEANNFTQARRALSPDAIHRLQATTDLRRDENEDTVSDVLSLTLQHLFCREPDQATDDLNMWPDYDRAHVKATMRDELSKAYPQLAGELKNW
jgi:hypothetical protein